MRIRDKRTEAGLTQRELAEKAGIARELIARAETGTSVPDISTLIKIADALGCQLDELVGRNVDPEGGAGNASETV